MKVSVIIRCYNEERFIGKLLSGVVQQTIEADNLEIIVVDSGSTDATISIASHFPIRLVHISKDDFTFGRSLNRGCAAATGDILVMASAHVYPVYDDWLEELVQPFKDNPDIALVYGKQIGNEVTKYSEHQLFASWFPDESIANQSHPFCNNANSAIRRDIWEKIPYDESLTGLEDLDWAKRAMEQSYQVAYAADAPIVHVHEETPKRIYNRYRREAMALKRIFPEQQMSFGNFVNLSASNIYSDYRQAIRDRKLLPNLFDIAMFRTMQFWGAFRGFRDSSLPIEQVRRTFYYPASTSKPPLAMRMNHDRQPIDYNQPQVAEH